MRVFALLRRLQVTSLKMFHGIDKFWKFVFSKVSSFLDESHHLLVKFHARPLVKTSMALVQDMQYAFCSQYWSCSWARRHCDRQHDCDFMFTRFWCRLHQQVQSKPSSDFALWRHWLSKLAYKTCAHIRRGCCPVLERLVDVCSW